MDPIVRGRLLRANADPVTRMISKLLGNLLETTVNPKECVFATHMQNSMIAVELVVVMTFNWSGLELWNVSITYS